jgi:peptidoglycan/LPS O-acetylase OafA/YrhL
MSAADNRIVHFKGIEGLRGWLACIVMACHVVRLAGMHLHYPILDGLDQVAEMSVALFIIVSGFVITHLLLSKPESFSAYISRRFLRIYPVYLVCLALGIIALRLYLAAYRNEPWGSLSPLTRLDAIQMSNESFEHFIPNLVAHLTMLHGAIPDNVLYGARVALLPPAWSLSLEWQFYLLAPFIIHAICRSVSARIWLAFITVIGFWACEVGFLGVFFQPRSVLPGAALLFSAGITSRFLIYKLPEITIYPVAAAIVGSLAVTLSAELIPFFAWALFIVWMRLKNTSDRASAALKSGFDLLFDSKAARLIGDMSYPIYLVHVPVIQIILCVCVQQLRMDAAHTCLTAIVFSPLVTGICAYALHIFVEKPCIKYGRTLFARPTIHTEVLAH